MNELKKKAVQMTTFLLIMCMGISFSFAGGMGLPQVKQTTQGQTYQPIPDPEGATETPSIEENLIAACMEGNQEEVISILQENEISVEDKGRAFYAAAGYGHLDILQILLGDNPQSFDKDTLAISLGAAAENGQKEIVEFLLKYVDANAFTIPEGHWTALMQAAHAGKMEIVELLLEKGAKVDKKNTFSMTALMIACAQGNVDVVRRLLEANPKLLEDATDQAYQWGSLVVPGGTTALMIAAFYGQLDVMKVLIEEYGADVYAVDDARYTVLGCSQRGDRAGYNMKGKEIAEYLRSKDVTKNRLDVIILNKKKQEQVWDMQTFVWDDLIAACADGNIAFVEYFFRKNPVTEYGKIQAYFTAINNGKLKLVQKFVQEEWVPADADFQGVTSLGLAAIMGYWDMLDFLLEQKVDLEKRSYMNVYFGATIFMITVHLGNVDMAKKIQKKGADVNATDEEGKTALQYILSAQWKANKRLEELEKQLKDTALTPAEKNNVQKNIDALLRRKQDLGVMDGYLQSIGAK